MSIQTLNAWLMKPWAKPLTWLLCAVPLALLCVGVATDQLGPDPVEKFLKETGEWSLRFLWFTLAITPLRDLAGLPGLLRHRRALGLTAFVYAFVHFVTYAWLDQGWQVDEIVADVLKRNFILVGFVALLVMLPKK